MQPQYDGTSALNTHIHTQEAMKQQKEMTSIMTFETVKSSNSFSCAGLQSQSENNCLSH